MNSNKNEMNNKQPTHGEKKNQQINKITIRNQTNQQNKRNQ